MRLNGDVFISSSKARAFSPILASKLEAHAELRPFLSFDNLSLFATVHVGVGLD